MLNSENTILVIIDVQGNLAHSMWQKEILFKNFRELIKGMEVLKIPILLTEQNPKGLGPTIPELSELLPDNEPVPKMTFSCCGDEVFMTKLKASNRKQILIAGIETHICVYQTAVQLRSMGYEVQVITDAVASRTIENKEVGLKKMNKVGVDLTSIEMAFYELLGTAEDERFRELLKIVKESG